MARTQPYPLPNVPSDSEEEEEEKAVEVKFVKEAGEQEAKEDQQKQEEDKEEEVRFTKIAVEQEAKEDQQEEGGDARKQEQLGGVDKGKRPIGESSTTTPGLKTNYDDDDDGFKSPVTKKQKMIIPTIIIEYCLSEDCRLILEQKAQEVKEELEAAINGIEVKINPELPTTYEGWFQVRSEEDGKIWRNYGDMSSSPLEVWGLDISELVEEVKSSIHGSKDA